MNINRDNYEMYFLLFVDKELSAEERNAVEKFVADNPDLKEELESLIAATLPIEAINFDAKKLLYKNDVATDELKEQLLLHLDNELDAASVVSLESAITEDSSLAREWNILQQTKLDPAEKIIFENKALLYRHERDNVVSMRFWRRTAVAAAIVGAGIFVGISFFTKDQHSQDIAVNNSNEQPDQKNNFPGKTNTTVKENNASEKQQIAVTPGSDKQQTSNGSVKEDTIQHPPSNPENLASNSINIKKTSPLNNKITPNAQQKNVLNNTIVKKETNNLPKPYFENINNLESNKTISSNVQDNMKGFTDKKEPANVEGDAIAKNDVKLPKVKIEDTQLTVTPNTYAKNAVMDESASETNNNSILFMSEEKLNRSKVGGLFKKAKRVLARNIKSGNSLKIAGFEIAAK